MTAISIHVEGVFHPQAQQIIGEVIQNYGGIDDVFLYTPNLEREIPCLALGSLPEALPINYVKTISQKQIMSNPAVVTELTASLNLLLKPVEYPPMKFTLLDGPLSMADYLKIGRVVVVDIETGGDIKTLLPQELWLLSLSIFDGKNLYVWTQEALRRPDVREQLIRLFQSTRKLVAHNMKFDFRTLTEVLGIPIFGHLDTMLLHHAINPGSKEHGLKEVVRKYLGAEDWDKDIKKYTTGSYKKIKGKIQMPDGIYYPQYLIDHAEASGEPLPKGYELIPKELLYEYNAYDVYWTWYLLQYLSRAAEGDPRIARIAKFEFAMGNFFQEVESAGLAVDIEYLNYLDEKYRPEIAQHLSDIRFLVQDDNFNPGSWQQVKRYLHSIGVMVKKTEEKVLMKEYPKMNPAGKAFVDKLLDYRGVVKEHGVYVKGILDRQRDHIVYPTFKVHGTNTGRLSSSNPNVQNVPRDTERDSLRRVYIPRAPDRSLVNVDYSQAELRVMACLSKDEYLISLFQPGMPDFFDSLMPTAFPRIDLEKLTKDEKKNYRAKLKATIYGLAYNRKAAAIAEDLKMSVREAQSIINNFFKAAPDFYEWRMWVEGMAVSDVDTLVSPFGRYYQSEAVTGRSKQNIINAGLAFLPQSTASDFCVKAAMKIHEQIRGSDIFIIATVHDAILFDAPDDKIQWISDLAQKEMEAAAFETFQAVPFSTDASFGKSWEGI